MDFRVQVAMGHDAIPDAEAHYAESNGMTWFTPVEVLTSNYSDAVINHKVRDLPRNTRFFGETLMLCERVSAVTGCYPQCIVLNRARS